MITVILSLSSKQADLLPGVFGLRVCPVCPGRPVHSCLSAVRQDGHGERLLWYVRGIILQGSKHRVVLCTHTLIQSGYSFQPNAGWKIKKTEWLYTHALCAHLNCQVVDRCCWLFGLGKHLEIDFLLWNNSSSLHSKPKMVDCELRASPLDGVGWRRAYFVCRAGWMVSPGLCVWRFWRKTVMAASSTQKLWPF